MALGFRIASEEEAVLLNDREDPLHKVISKQQRRAGNVQVALLCWAFFLIGWGDGSTGPLIPSIQTDYMLSFSQVSYIFLLGCVGAVVAQTVVVPVVEFLGFGRSLTLGAAIQMAALAVQGLSCPFWVFLLVYMFSKIGVSFEKFALTVIKAAQANSFVAILKHNQEAKMGYLHAAYGFGALAAPLSATFFSQSPHGWRVHFTLSAMLACTNFILMATIFAGKTEDDCLLAAGEDTLIVERAKGSESNLRQILRLKTVHLLSAFMIIYVGAEVTIGGWIVSFMLLERDGSQWSGYVATGFFAGITLGRILLLPINKMLGETRGVYVYCIFAILFQFVVWFTPSFIASAIAVSIVGLLLGPVFPLVITYVGKSVPRSLAVAAVSWIGTSGAFGATLVPYFTGAMADKFGIAVMQPISVTLLSALLFIWCLEIIRVQEKIIS